MTEQNAERGGQQEQDVQQQEAKTRLLTDYVGGDAQSSNELSGINSTGLGRVLYVTGEGLAKTPMAAWHAVTNTTKEELLHTGAMGAAFGVGFRLLLPQTGAMRALVGTTMGVFFIKDAAQPVLQGWQQAYGAQDMAEMTAASDTMSAGLGKFAYHNAVGLVTGVAAEVGTGYLLASTARGRQFEMWKERQFNSDDTAVGRFFKGSERVADRTSDKVAAALLERRRSVFGEELTLAEKLEAIKQVRQHHAVGDGHPTTASGQPANSRIDLDHILAERKRYRSEEFTTKIDDLLQGTGHGDTTPAVTAELSQASRMRLTGGDPPGKSGPEFPPNQGDNVPTTGGKTTGGGTGDGPTPPLGTGGDTAGKIVITDAAAGPTPTQRPTGDINGVNVGDMAVAMRQATGRVTKEDIVVAQAKEDIAGPLSSTMRSGEAPLDKGHFPNSELVLGLTDQIRTADDYRAAGMLLDHFRTSTQQIEIAARGNRGGLNAITDLNQFSRSVHSQLLHALDQNGIPRDVVRGSNSPLFTIRDSDGAGPYTIPAIRDPKTGKPVTDAAVVTYPREYQGMEGVHTAGVYPHELGHDLIYGDLLRFPKEARDSILTQKIVGDAMKAKGIADVDVQVPGSPTGVMKKSDLFVQLLKAQANENTADMFGTSVDPHTGLSLATLLGSLRKPDGKNPNGPGLLETRSMYGKDMVDVNMGNTLGIEPHGIDRWRIKLSAETLRELGGPNAPKALTDYANHLDTLADTMARPGTQYVWAHADKPGEFVSVSMQEWDAIIPALVQAQFRTPLESLNGHTLKDIAPNVGERFTRVETLAQHMADAALKGQSTVSGFDKTGYRIEEVFSAGLYAWTKAIAKNAEAGGNRSAENLMGSINKISESLRAQYRNDVPETILNTGPQGQPMSAKIADLAYKPLGALKSWTGHAVEGQPRLRERVAAWTPRLGGYVGAAYGPTLFEDIMSTKAVENSVMNQTQPGENK
jgi:hypothetical protein